MQCKSLRDSGSQVDGDAVAYFMISVDAPEKNKKFAEKTKANFPILSDPTKKTAAAYGVLKSGGGSARRWTFYIDKAGVIQKIDKDVRLRKAGADMVAVLALLAAPKNEE